MEELWKDIQGYEGLYQVSNTGRVRSLDKTRAIGKNKRIIKGRILKIKQANYCHIQLVKNGQNFHALVHRLVATAFIPNSEGKKTVNHKDCNKHNNRVENLEWVTQAENNLHALSNGKLATMKRGDSHYRRSKKYDQLTQVWI
jgi:hypothetical protein